jgi:deoxyinosine 3'endonuclease (endonuclease V)
MVDFGQLKEIQKQTAKQVTTEDAIEKDKIKYIAGFDIAFVKSTI